MVEIHKRETVPYSADEMYSLVNDIESYPDFLPWCKNAEILEPGTGRLKACIYLEAGKIKQSFSTQNTMQPGKSIDMKLLEGPFKFLTGHWQFDAVDDNTCTVKLDIAFEFKNKLLKLALSGTFHRILDTLVDSFVRRAESVYGRR